MTLLTAHEVQQMLNCSLALVYKLANQKRLPCVRWECPGKGKEKPRTVVRFKYEDIARFIEGNYNGQ
ncbi:MAG: helix-turn-helix domain-containing protein [Deltaproteobacteria bacterium]|nr:helix-turn-helix domain-containing protein [Deltaproteobacteria bacterium]